MCGEMRSQPADDSFLRATVRLGDDIDLALIADLYRAVELLQQNAASFARSLDGNFQKWIHLARNSPLWMMPEVRGIRKARSVGLPAEVIRLLAADFAVAIDADFQRAVFPCGRPWIGVVRQTILRAKLLVD